MDLRQRLARLSSYPPAGAEAPPSDTRARLDRLLGSAPGARGNQRIGDEAVAARLGGVLVGPGVVLVEHRVPLDHLHGRVVLGRLREAPLGVLAPSAPKPAELLFLDTETTGLAGGTGTLPFLLGLARLEGQGLQVRQYLLTGFAGEAALQEHARPWLEAGGHLVSYNGKRFDLPLLVTRHRLQRRACPLQDKPHLDLLHPTRAAFGSVWPDCRLQQAEARLLGLVRSDDLPGWQVPQVWTGFVRTGVLGDLPRVLEHNLLDVMTLAALLVELAWVHARPGYARADPHALARGRLRVGQQAQALAHLQAGRDGLDTGGLLELARLHRRREEWDKAVAIWEGLARQGVIEARLSLAKYYEHEARDYRRALQACRELIAGEPLEMAHRQRLERVQRKAAGEETGCLIDAGEGDRSGAGGGREDGADGWL